MTQIVVTLANNADETLLRRMIENMKGVVKTTLSHSPQIQSPSETSNFLDALHDIGSNIDPSIIDLSDPRTKYIMSK